MDKATGEMMGQQVSILIPCYNAGAWIGRAIESALGQCGGDVEVIVVDDGSTDDSLDVSQSFGSRIILETGPNRGGNAARNRLLELSTGEWLQFLDADDELLPGKIECQMALTKSSIDAVYGGVTLEWWEGGKVCQRRVSLPEAALAPEVHWLKWQLAHTGAVLWRASSLRAIGGWNENFACCQDNEVCLRALENGLRFDRSEDAGSLYRIWSASSVCRSNLERLVETKTKLIDDMMDWLRSKGEAHAIHQSLAAQACFGMARQLAVLNPVGAFDYATERTQKGLFDPTAAPWGFRMLCRTFGYPMAEKVASIQRGVRRALNYH